MIYKKLINRNELFNFFMRSGDFVIKFLVSFITIVILTKYVSVEQFGFYNLMQVFLGAGLSIGMFGIKPIIFKKILRDNKFQFFVFPQLVFFNFLIFIFFSILFYLLYNPPIIYLIVFLSILSNPFNIFRYKYDALLNSGKYLLLDSLIKILFLIIKVYILVVFQSLPFLFFTIFCEYLFLSYAIVMISSFDFHLLKFSILDSKKFLKLTTKPFFISICYLFFLKVDLIFVSKLCTDYDTGIYSFSSRLTDLLVMFPLLFINTIQPRLNMLFDSGRPALLEYIKTFISRILTISPVILLILYFTITNLVYSMFSNYSEFTSYFIFHILYIYLIFIMIVFDSFHHASQNYLFYLKRVIVILILNFPLNYLLILKLGAVGAIISTNICFIVGICLELYFFRVYFKNHA